MVSLIWVGFIVFVLAMLALDLWVVNRGSHVISAGKALRWTGFFIAVALAFNVLVYLMYEHHLLGIGERVGSDLSGKDAALQYFTGWLLEYSLSLDNVFVIALIFRHFAVPKQYQHRVLFWGILGALVMRGVMIAAGAALIHRFHATIYVFGALLLLTAIRLMFTGEKEPEPESGFVFRTARRLLPVAAPPHQRPMLSCPQCGQALESLPIAADVRTCPECGSGIPALAPGQGTGPVQGRASDLPPPYPDEHGDRFFLRQAGRLMVTPLFLVLLVVETTDVVFAVDSIPAIFGVTQDPFLVFTSNVFAILGLRTLYFALAAVMDKFRYLKTALVFVLAFVGIKMLLPLVGTEISIELSLGIIAGLLGAGVAASMLVSRRERLRRPAPVEDFAEAAEEAWRRSRRWVILTIGLSIVVLSIPIGLLPGPGGLFVAFGGLALLATEFVWARHLLKRVRERTHAVTDVFIGPRPTRPIVVLAVLIGVAAVIVLALSYRSHGALLIWSAGLGAGAAAWGVWSLVRWSPFRRSDGAAATRKPLTGAPLPSPPDSPPP
jgi:tellurite resistance protein TerC